MTILLSTALTACGSDESSSPSAPSATSAASSSPDAAASSTAPATSEESSSPDAETSASDAPYQANDATQVYTDLAEQWAQILMKALKSANKPDKVSAAYNEPADLYEDAVAKVETEDAKDAFFSLGRAYRTVAKNGAGDTSDELNKAHEKFVSACFGG